MESLEKRGDKLLYHYIQYIWVATKQQRDFILMNVNSADIVNVARTDDVITAAVFVLKYIVGEKRLLR